MNISKGRNKFCIYSLIQFFEMFTDVRNVLIVYVTLCLKPPINAQFAASNSTAGILLKTYKLVNRFQNFFLNIGIFKFICANFPSKVFVSFIGDLNFGPRNLLVVRCDSYGITTTHAFVGSG